MFIKFKLLFLGLISLLIISGCNTPTIPTIVNPNSPPSGPYLPTEQSDPSSQPQSQSDSSPITQPTNPAPPPQHRETITLVAAGDVLMHKTEILSGRQADGSYKFDFFSPVKDLLKAGDYCSTDFESAMAGPGSGYTGYPAFNSPDAMADTFKEAGFNLVVNANNHILDRGYKGAVRTIDVLHQAGLDTTGAFKSHEDQNSFLIKDIRGVKVGYLAYTYGTNGIPIPKDHPYLVNILNREKVLKDIAELRPQVDVLILVLHWGVEYNPEATSEQKTLAHDFLEAGADVILGSHPHVIEPMEVIKNGDKNKFVIYSMGNFIGHQTGIERNSGIILNFKFTKDFSSGETILVEVSYTPTYSFYFMDKGKLQFRVVPVEKTINNIKENKDPYFTVKDLPMLNQILTQTRKTLGAGFKEAE